jgi:hypothetical protein
MSSIVLTRKAELGMARCRKILERKHIGKIEAIPAAVSLDFSDAFAPKRLRQMAVPNSGFRV